MRLDRVGAGWKTSLLSSADDQSHWEPWLPHSQGNSWSPGQMTSAALACYRVLWGEARFLGRAFASSCPAQLRSSLFPSLALSALPRSDKPLVPYRMPSQPQIPTQGRSQMIRAPPRSAVSTAQESHFNLTLQQSPIISAKERDPW